MRRRPCQGDSWGNAGGKSITAEDTGSRGGGDGIRLTQALSRLLTQATDRAESTARVLHPPGHVVLGGGILSGPFHDRRYFLAERLWQNDGSS